MTFLTQPALQLENFSEVKREKLLQKYQDMRVMMGFQLLSMWSLLGRCRPADDTRELTPGAAMADWA